MDYNNGLGYGNDMIQSFSPMEFEHSELPSGKKILAAPSEYPILNTIKPRPRGDLSEHRVNKTLETPVGMVESFMPHRQNQNYILFFLFLIVIVIQFQMLKQMKRLNKMQLCSMLKNPMI